MGLAGCGEQTLGQQREQQTVTNRSSPDAETLPAGWRWETFGGAQVGVPDDWGWTNGSQRIGQWCVDTGRPRDLEPAVGRPGASTLVGCNTDEGVPKETLTRHTGNIVAFESAALDRVPDTGDRRTVVVGDAAVIIQTNDPTLRDRIAGTVHQITVDAAGCPVADPVAEDPSDRPMAAAELATITGVRSVAACKYAVHRPEGAGRVPPLLASRTFAGPAATDLVHALVAAPVGGGPNAPEDCMPEYSYGDELLVLLIAHEEGTLRVKVTYSGCDHNGIDDGTTMRRLTREAMASLNSGPLAVSSYSGVLRGILSPN
jgi:hypothetical protein